MVESRNVEFIETPAKLVSLPTNEPDNINDMDNIDIHSFHAVQEGHDMLRDVRDYRLRVDMNNDVTYDRTISIVQPRNPATARDPDENPWIHPSGFTASTDYSHRRTTAADICRQQLMASNSGGALPQHQVTPALTRSRSRVASALLVTAALRKLQ